MEENIHSLKKIARHAGLLYFMLVLLAPFSLLYIPDKIIVAGNATATSNFILIHESMFRFGILISLVGDILVIYLVVTLYRLFKGVSRTHARQLVALVLVSVAIAFVSEIFELGAIVVLNGDDYLKVFNQDQLNGIAMILVKLHGRGIAINEIFWGLWLVPFGILVMKSGFIPKVLGILMMFPAFGYMLQSFTRLFMPEFYPEVIGIIMLICGFGELPIIFWLLIKGVKTPKEILPAMVV